MRWDITDSLRLRTAYTRVVKPALASNRLLEPTQVAGFNQFFDDGNGTRSTRYGVALDWRAMPSLFVGGELSRRDIDHRVVDLTAVTADFQDREEHTHRAYLYWTPSARWALSAEAIYDKFENSVSDPDVPDQVITRSFPFRARYFHPGGLFLEGSATYVSQDVRRPVGSTLAQGDSSFGVLGLSAGYRLPKRLGIVSFSVDNLLDKKMDFQDDSYRNFDREPTGTPYTPERTFMGRVSLNFR